MTRIILMAIVAALTAVLVSCSKPADSEHVSDNPPAEASASASVRRDPCTLIDDPAALFGQPVTASEKTTHNQVKSCQWANAEGRLCGMVTPMGSDWNEVPDVPVNYSAMVQSMGAFGKVEAIAGIGDEAVIVDAGMLGAQMALRKGNSIANIGAACGGSGPANLEAAQKIARSVAGKF